MKRYLKKIILSNIGIHEKFECELTPETNIITGASGTGKSWIIRAIQSLYFNRPSIETLRRNGSKKSSIVFKYSDNIEIERLFSKSINRYVLRIPDKEEQVFDSVGRDVPEEIQQIISAYPVKIDTTTFYMPLQHQFRNSLFLFDDNISPATKQKLFNLLTGNDTLDKLFKDFNKDILAENRNIKHYEKDLNEKQAQLNEVTKQHAKKTEVLGNVNDIVLKIENDYIQLEKIEDIYNRLIDCNRNLENTKNKIKSLKAIKNESIKKLEEELNKLQAIVSKNAQIQELITKKDSTTRKLETLKIGTNTCELEALIEQFGKVQSIYNKLNENNKKLEQLNNEEQRYKLVPKKIADFPVLEKEIEKLHKANEIFLKIKNREKILESIPIDIQELDKRIKEKEQEFKNLLKEAGVCPLCGSEQ